MAVMRLMQTSIPCTNSFCRYRSEFCSRVGDDPGVVEAIRKLQAAGLRIGSSTGYTRELMDVVVPEAAAQGYRLKLC